MTDPTPDKAAPTSLGPPLLALAAIGVACLWASWAARDAALANRTRQRLA